ncbi:MAG: energy transducer TonB [Gammaproteobacteria bacterium]|nr:MAG: energy transducer TonB [Gammaproteobacteria bacterium]
MSETVPKPPRIQPRDRLMLALFLAATLHALVILGVGFDFDLEHIKPPPTLNIILVQSRAQKAPEDAEFLAQANQQASGSSEQKGRPSSPVTSLDPRPSPGQAPIRMRAATPPQEQKAQNRVLTGQDSERKVREKRNAERERTKKKITGQQLVDRSLEIARLTSELNRETQRYAQRPRIRFIDAVSTRSVVEASYIDSWVRKVERIGNLNYPDEAIRRRLSGKLILNVLIDNQGRVLDIEVAQSSGEQVLDDAAKRIVELSAPFPPFPNDMRKTYDQLMITRTWVFHSDNSLSTR